MKLSKTQRLILFNQYKILASTDTQIQHQKPFYEEKVQILQMGIECRYDQLFNELHKKVSKKAYKKVHEILTMYHAINFFKEQEGIDFDKIAFEGIDHKDTKYFAALTFIINKEKTFEDVAIAGSILDSRTSTSLPKYKKLLKVFKHATKKQTAKLTLDGLKEMIEAA